MVTAEAFPAEKKRVQNRLTMTLPFMLLIGLVWRGDGLTD